MVAGNPPVGASPVNPRWWGPGLRYLRRGPPTAPNRRSSVTSVLGVRVFVLLPLTCQLVLTTNPDDPLAPARRRLADAVCALADPVPQRVVCRWSDSVYERLRTELAGGRVVAPRRVHASRLPCHAGVLALLVEIDAAVGSWCPGGKTTVDRLRLLAGRVGARRTAS